MSMTPLSGSSRERLDLGSGIEALQSSPEFRGPVEPFDGHYCNDHLALIYESKTEQYAAVVPYLRQGIERGERCMCVIDDSTEAELLAALRGAGIDADAAVESGQLTFHTVEETYLRDGTFEPDGMIDIYGEIIEETKAEYPALRISAEISWLAEGGTPLEKFMEYESRINELFDEEDCIALCQYDRRSFPSETIRDVIRTHPHLIYDGTVCHNFYHVPPEDFFDPDDAEQEVDRMMGTLLDRTEAKVALESRERFLREIYDATADPSLSFGAKVERLLELGRAWFDLDVGYFALTDEDEDEFEVIEAVGSHEKIRPGASGDLSVSYCQNVLELDEPVSVLNAEEEGWTGDPAYDTYGLESYFGTSLVVGGKQYGTLCFGSESSRGRPFTRSEYTFLELMSQWVSYELERKERERYQRKLYEITSNPDQTFEEKIERLLELGCERFGLEYGILGRYDGDDAEVEATVGPADGGVSPGEFPVRPKAGQYCRKAMDADEPVGAPDVRELGWDDDPVYRELGFESYFGVKIATGSEPYGTLAFCDTSTREDPFTDAEHTFLELMGQWVNYELEQRRREEQLAALNEMSRDLMNVETVSEIAETTVEHAHESLRLPLSAVALYDAENGRLAPEAQTTRAEDELPTATLCNSTSGPVWEAFVAGEMRAIDVGGDDGLPANDLTQILVVPLDRQGVFLTGTASPEKFDSLERDFVETTAATVESACTRADREQLLHEREETLEDQNETLERLNRINTTIRNIDQALVQASTREEIEEVACEQLADVGPYELAWVGEQNTVSDVIEPRTWAGDENGYLHDERMTVDDTPEGRGPAGRAVETREPQVVNDILSDRSFAPWRQSALNRGYHACIALPLTYKDTLYGILAVYAGQPGVFDSLERAVLTELSDTIAYAINAVESKKALVTDEVTELEFTVEDIGCGITEFVEQADCTMSLENLVSQGDGGLRAFFSMHGTTTEEIREFAPKFPTADLTVVSEFSEGDDRVCLVDVTLTEDSLAGTVLQHGGRLRRLDADDGNARVTVALASDAAVREFVEMFRTRYPNATLHAQHTRQQVQRTSAEFQSEVVEELTPRQLEVLQTAYFSGYFEKPRTRTGTEIASSLDISQPTLNTHLRAAQRKLYHQLFEEGLIQA
ncbi:MEDS domain-containing protein [Halopelagius longus]|nr:MEDS domain-containing protein [Halopelagius longus]SDQ89996.1 GAF domain-containing protein [Halopelagius longus]